MVSVAMPVLSFTSTVVNLVVVDIALKGPVARGTRLKSFERIISEKKKKKNMSTTK